MLSSIKLVDPTFVAIGAAILLDGNTNSESVSFKRLPKIQTRPEIKRLLKSQKCGVMYD